MKLYPKPAKFDSKCQTCGKTIAKGELTYFGKDEAEKWVVVCPKCYAEHHEDPVVSDNPLGDMESDGAFANLKAILGDKSDSDMTPTAAIINKPGAHFPERTGALFESVD